MKAEGRAYNLDFFNLIGAVEIVPSLCRFGELRSLDSRGRLSLHEFFRSRYLSIFGALCLASRPIGDRGHMDCGHMH